MNFGPIKLLFTAVAALLILGPKRLPAALRSFARALGELKKASAEVTEELRSGLDAGSDSSWIAPAPISAPTSAPLSASLPASLPDAPRAAATEIPPEEELRPGPR
jgi:Sec-independent protein translocase protein TatA